MLSPPKAILSIAPIDAETGVVDWRSAAGALNIDTILIDEPIALFDDRLDDRIATIVAAGLAPMVAIDVGRFPIDHVMVSQSPTSFAIRREAVGATVDPRGAMPARGQALARTRDADSVAALAQVIGDRLAELTSRGVAGFRLDDPARLSPALIAALADRLPRAALLIAGPGADTTAARNLAQAGLDGIVTALAAWHRDAPWLVEEIASLSGSATVWFALPVDAPSAVDALRLAGWLGNVIVPFSMIGSQTTLDRMAHALRSLPLPAPRGALRQAAGSDGILCLVRGDTADMRRATSIRRRAAQQWPGRATRPRRGGADAVGRRGRGGGAR